MGVAFRLGVVMLLFLFGCRKEGDFQKFGEISLNTSSAQLATSGQLRHPVDFIDVDGNGRYDGIDLNKDGIPELLFTWPFSPSVGLDANGDGMADYYMFLEEQNRIRITRRADGSGGNVQVVVDKTSTTNPKKPIGYDTNADCNYEIDPSDTGNPNAAENPSCVEDKILTSIYADTTPPVGTANLTPGAYASPIDVTVVCSDNVACNAITYSFGLQSPPPDNPSFDPAAMKLIQAMVRGIKAGDSVTIPLTGLLPGAYQIKYIVRDANGNMSSLQALNFTIGEPAQVTITGVSRTHISRQAGAFNTTQITFWSDRAGTFKLRKVGNCSHADFDASGNPVNNPAADVAHPTAKGSLGALVSHTATVSAPVDFPAPTPDGKKTIVICFRDSSTTIVTKKPVEIYLDNVAPVVEVNPEGGNFAMSTIFQINCADTSGCLGILARVGPGDGTPPANPNGSIIPLNWPYNEFTTTAPMTAGQDYFSPNTTINQLAGPAASSTDPDPYNYTYKIVARDRAGNISAIKTVQFALGGNTTPLITRLAVRNNADTANLPSDNSLSDPPPPPTHLASQGWYYLRAETGLTHNGHQALRWRWRSNRAGTYEVRIGTCSTGILSTGANATGSVLANQDVTVQILASDLAPGSNDVRVCFNSYGHLGEGYLAVRRWQFNSVTSEVTVFDRNLGETATLDLKNIYAPANPIMQGLINNVAPTRYTSSGIDGDPPCSDSASWNGAAKELTITTSSLELCNYVYTHTLVDPAGIQYGPIAIYVYSYEDKNNAIFVGGPGASDANPGTSRSAPKATLTAAITAATPGKKDVYIYSGIAPLTSTLNLPSGVSLYGGYKTDGPYAWMRKTAASADRTLIVNAPGSVSTGLAMAHVNDPTVISAVRVVVQNATFGHHVFGAKIENGTASLTVRRSNFEAGNTDLGAASSDAKSSYGFYARGVSTLVLHHNYIKSGQGQPGDTGTAGFSATTPGQNGGPGTGGITGCSLCGNNDNSWRPGGSGGGGGTNSHMPALNGHPGGAGGAGAFQNDPATNGLPGSPGGGPGGGSGGGGGTGGNQTCPSCSGCGAKTGGSGGHGSNGVHGTDGNPAHAQGFFDLTSFLLKALQSGNGTHGTPGSGGGGGGGGGNDTCCLNDSGSGGGGGGGGGAAGSGGTGGFAGGSSVGIALVNINYATVQGNTVERQIGGTGGQGGPGGTGSAGGLGGPGGGCNDGGGAGGLGGNGGAGGNGGDGAGGNGGHSLGILRYQVTSFTGGSNSFLGGGSAAGGTSSGNPGHSGMNYNCWQFTSSTSGTTCTP
ncbi:MAG: hypothetical protein NZM25_00810 [Leptospiraceae bacterium]|nr:hypothetical protein [Leptospiraceae bacterium]MDW8306266.1 hypothetical protein [Leptospiraceae bacterium]